MEIRRREHVEDFRKRASVSYRDKRPLFDYMDQRGGKNRITTYALGEIAEVAEELDAPGGQDTQKVLDELNDVFNMIMPLAIMSYGKDFQPSHHLLGVNGEGNDSKAIDKLKEAVSNSEDDARAIIESLRLLFSIGNHVTDADETTRIASVIKTFEKVSNNYPEPLYSGKDPLTGKHLTDEEKPLVFEHATKGLKVIRKAVNRTLQPTIDLPPFKEHVINWRNSETAIAALQSQLESSRNVRHGVAQLESSITVPSPEMTIQINQKNGTIFSNSK